MRSTGVSVQKIMIITIEVRYRIRNGDSSVIKPKENNKRVRDENIKHNNNSNKRTTETKTYYSSTVIASKNIFSRCKRQQQRPT